MNIVFSANLNIMTDLVHPAERLSIIEKSYLGILNAHSEFKVPISIFASGWSLEFINKVNKPCINYIKSLISSELLTIGSHTYGHGVLPLLDSEDTNLQIKLDLEVHEELLGNKPAGFLPPEWLFDYTLPELLLKHNFKWILLGGSNFVGYYGQTEADLLRVNNILGPDNKKLPVFINYGDKSLNFRDLLFSVFSGNSPLELFNFLLNMAQSKPVDSVFVLYFDLETAYFNYSNSNNPIDNYRSILSLLSKASSLSPTTFDKYLFTYSPSTHIVYPYLPGNYKPITFWKNGSEKLDQIQNETKPLVYAALRTKHPNSKVALKYYLAGQTSDARSAASEARAIGIQVSPSDKIYFGQHSTILESIENLYKAKKIAQEVIKNTTD